MRRVWLTSLVLFLATFAVFSRVLLGEFVQWDDDINIYQTPTSKGLDQARIALDLHDLRATRLAICR